MQYTLRQNDSKESDKELFFTLEPLIRGINMALIELNVFHTKGRGGRAGGVQVKAVVYKAGNTGLEDCSKVHRLIMPRLELAFSGYDIYLEVSSPGIERIIKDGSEFVHYIGRALNCYRTDISDWTTGILLAADEKKLVLETETGEISLPYEIVAKARLAANAHPKEAPRSSKKT